MKPLERQKSILNLLRILHREWTVAELAQEFDISELTIRRDLTELAESGDIIRTHGGCVAFGDGALSTVFYKQFEQSFEEKREIGKEATRLIKPGDTILLGDGSTTFQFASQLEKCPPITVYTNNIAAIQQLKMVPNIRLYLLGGEYGHQYNMLYLKGSLSDRILETLHFNLIIIGTDAINDQGECLSYNEEVARTNQLLLRRGDRKILLADHGKIKISANVIYGKLDDFDLWITSPGIDPERLNVFKKQTKISVVKVDKKKE